MYFTLIWQKLESRSCDLVNILYSKDPNYQHLLKLFSSLFNVHTYFN